ncbi:amino acid ABC transporter substrate-binding protein, partial [Pantoea dispersa]|nr:amino acid ABC transporter substrate-binding protein [Pantoea dispersa]
MNKVLLAVAGAALLMAQAGSAMSDKLQDIHKRGVIRVAVPQD